MAEQVTNYQCPACTGPLHYDGRIGKLKCDYCGSTYEVEEIEALYREKEEAAAKAAAAEEQEQQSEGTQAGDQSAAEQKTDGQDADEDTSEDDDLLAMLEGMN